ncbi:P-loop containing nucleoside triphosphate hydrolase protein [Thozetella sp. PMI_491]|nr:P-loop containing nucleoside triphosphate hydrolase protein [Thozetella sp. PMI_491]
MSTTLRIASGFSFYTGLFGYENKGAGLTFLLYGPSGVGKTLTAECVAEALRLPLYRVSGSEIGTGVWEVERRLTKAFSRTARWSAILLFDEAETFMAKRSDESLERNAMVSCLLRLLEYHTGIVILTTNRIIDFDAAFHSRIHVSLEYKALSEAEKMAVWRKEVAGRVGSAHCISDEDFTALARLDLDGRTIHNVVHVLKMYMQGEKGIVSLSHVKEILRVATGKLQGEGRRQVEEFCG